MKIRLTTTAPSVSALEAEFARRLPRYRCAIRTGRFHRFLVVSGDSPGAAIVVSSGTTIRIFGGFRADWLQFCWFLAMYCSGAMSIVGGFRIIAAVAGSAELGGAGVWQILASSVLVAGFEVRRRWSRQIIRDVAQALETSLNCDVDHR